MLALIRLSESESCQCGRAAASHLSAGLHRPRAQRPGPWGRHGGLTGLPGPTPPGGGPLPGTLRLSEPLASCQQPLGVGLAREADGRVVVSDSMTAPGRARARRRLTRSESDSKSEARLLVAN